MNDELNVIYLKLVSGEEVISVLQKYTDTTYTLKNPMKLYATLNDQGNASVAFTHLMPFSEENIFTINTKDVMVISYQPLSSVREHYSKNFPSSEEERKPH